MEVRDALPGRLGEDHPYTLVAANNLAIYLRGPGRWPGAQRSPARPARPHGARQRPPCHPVRGGQPRQRPRPTWASSPRPRPGASAIIAALGQALGDDHPDTLACRGQPRHHPARAGPAGRRPSALRDGAAGRAQPGRSAPATRPRRSAASGGGSTGISTRSRSDRCGGTGQRRRRVSRSAGQPAQDLGQHVQRAEVRGVRLHDAPSRAGMRSASQRAWLTGREDVARAVPEQHRAAMSAGSKPQGGRTRARRRSSRSRSCAAPRGRSRCSIDRMPLSATTRRSEVGQVRLAAERPGRPGSARIASAGRVSVRGQARVPVSAAAYSRTLDWAMPSYQSSPTAPRGREADQDRGPGHPLGQQRGAGQRVRGAAGAADDGEPRRSRSASAMARDVRGDVRDAAARHAGRSPRNRGGRRRSAGRPGGAVRTPGGAAQPAARRAVQQEHGACRPDPRTSE